MKTDVKTDRSAELKILQETFILLHEQLNLSQDLRLLVQLGQNLLEQKQLVSHGDWEGYLVKFGKTLTPPRGIRELQNYMKCAKYEKRNGVSFLAQQQGKTSLRSFLRFIDASLAEKIDTNLDYYPTPAYVTKALLDRETFSGLIWECACGNGAIAKMLPRPVYASDIADRGYGEKNINFLTSKKRVPNIITNPPFGQMIEFKNHALQLATKKVAMIMYLRQLGDEVKKGTPLKSVYAFDHDIKEWNLQRLAWYVWEIGYDGPIKIERIRQD